MKSILSALINTFSHHKPPKQIQDSKTDLRSKYTDSDSKFITVRNNRVHYKDQGRGETVLLLHGTASSLHTWDHWAEKLTAQYRVIRLDLPGFGLTGPDAEDRYEVADDVQFIFEFLKTLDISMFHIAGSSLGGRIAWEFSLQHPQLIKSLTLLNALGYPQASWPPAIKLGMMPGMGKIMPKLSSRSVFKLSLNDMYWDKTFITDSTVDRYYELSRLPGNSEAFPKRVRAKLDTLSEKIKRITAPTLILWGEEDKYFPVKNAFRFHSDIVASQLRVYKQVGHLPMEECSDASAADFFQFLASLSVGQTQTRLHRSSEQRQTILENEG